MADHADPNITASDSTSGSGAGTTTGPMGSSDLNTPPGSTVHGAGHNPFADVRIIPGGSAQMGHTGSARLAAAAEAVKANPPAELTDAIDHGYEPHDIALKGLFNFLATLVVTVIVSLFIVWGIISALLAHEANKDPIGSPVLVAHDPIPYPLQPSMEHDTVDHEDMEAMRQSVHEVLDSDGVTVGGRRHIKISDAMQQVLSLLPIQPAASSSTVQPASAQP